MVKTNKKSVVALIVMAFLLVASIVMAATGAWFTDQASDDANLPVNFGKVDITLTASDNLTTPAWDSTTTGLTDGARTQKVVPGSTFAGTYTVENEENNEDVFYKAEITAKLVKIADGSEVTGLTDYIKISIKKGDAATEYDVSTINDLKAGASDVFNVTVSITKDTPNKVGDIQLNGVEGVYEIVVEIKVVAVQQANFDKATDTFPTFVEQAGE